MIRVEHPVQNLGSLLEKIVGGGTPSKAVSRYFTGHLPFVTVKDFKSRRPISTQDQISDEGLANSSSELVPEDTLLITTRMTIGRVARFSSPVAINQDVKALFPKPCLDKSYLEWFLNSVTEYLESKGTGTTVKGIRLEDIRALPIPLPALNEQRRVVAKLDNLFARSRAAREELARVPHLVERYKQAVLKDAFAGELTADWREANEISLSETWREESLGNVVLDVRYGTAAKCHYEPKATPVLRIPNVAGGTIDATDLKYASFSPTEIKKLALKKGDLLVIRSNGSLNLVGRAALATTETIGYLFAGYLIRLRFDESQVDPSFAALALQEPTIRANVERLAKSTSGVNNINGEQLRGLRFQIPKVTEQNEIVTRVGEAHARMDRLVAESTRALEFLDRLDQAALVKAFRGELVL